MDLERFGQTLQPRGSSRRTVRRSAARLQICNCGASIGMSVGGLLMRGFLFGAVPAMHGFAATRARAEYQNFAAPEKEGPAVAARRAPAQ